MRNRFCRNKSDNAWHVSDYIFFGNSVYCFLIQNRVKTFSTRYSYKASLFTRLTKFLNITQYAKCKTSKDKIYLLKFKLFVRLYKWVTSSQGY